MNTVNRRVLIAKGETGYIKWYDATRLFGFIVPDNKALIVSPEHPDIFLHVRNLATGVHEVRDGQCVRFDVAINPSKGLIALNVEPHEPIF